MNQLVKISIAEFETHCVQLLDEVADTHRPIMITKHGKVVAQISPITEQQSQLFGLMKDSVLEEHDIISPIMEDWDVLK